LLGPPLRKELVAAQSIDLGEDSLDVLEVRLHRLQQHATPKTAHADFRPGQAEIPWQPHRLAATMLEKLRSSDAAHGFIPQFEGEIDT
jgi:hypothetical protein